MAPRPPPNSTRKVFVLPLSDFPVYYLPKSHEIVSCVIPSEEEAQSPRARRGQAPKGNPGAESN